jgi:hypothetical protein
MTVMTRSTHEKNSMATAQLQVLLGKIRPADIKYLKILIMTQMLRAQTSKYQEILQ